MSDRARTAAPHRLATSRHTVRHGRRMAAPDFRFIGKGVYGVPDAARISAVPAARIRRWLIGYQRPGDRRMRPAVMERQHELVDGRLALSFFDLVEVRIVDAFLRHGMRWRTLWHLHQKAKAIVGHQ